MARRAAIQSISDIIEAAVAGVAARTAAEVRKAIETRVSLKLSKAKQSQRPSRRSRGGRPAREEMTKWVADRNARRVPTFVIEVTGLDTKKKIVAKFGENAAFEKGKALPPILDGAKVTAKPQGTPKAARVVKARAPVVRKKAAVTGT